MPKGPAARIFDLVAHPLPGTLMPGPGSFNVIIGGKLAWRGVPAAAAAAIGSAKATSDAAIKVAEAATIAAAIPPALGLAAAKAAEEAVKASAAAAMGSMISGAAGGADIHACLTLLPLPPHGPGVVIDGSPTVLINGLPACRQGDTIIEAVGPPDKIVLGLPTVIIGDAPGAGGSAGAGAARVSPATAEIYDPPIETTWSPLDLVGFGSLLRGGLRIGGGILARLAGLLRGTVKLNPVQAKSLARFLKKIPANAKDSVKISKTPEGNVKFTATSPGKVPGSRAVYDKHVDATGKAVKYEKTTLDPSGKTVHVKDKLGRGAPK